MRFGLLSAGAALALLLCACGQKEAKAPAAPSGEVPSTSATAESAPDTATPPATSEASNALARRFEAKSGRIEFTLTGMQEGTETLTWDDYGARTVTETKSSVSFPGMPAAAAAAASQEQRVITQSDSMISLDLKTKTGTRIDGLNEKTAAMMGMKDPRQMQQMGEEMMKSMGATKSGSDTVAGKPCDIWTAEQMMGMTVCIWKGAALKTEGNMMGTTISKVATKIEENIAVDQALFEVPADFTINADPIPGQMPPGLADMMKGMTQPPVPPAASGN